MKKKNFRFFGLLIISIIAFNCFFKSNWSNEVKAKEDKGIKVYMVTNDKVIWFFEPNNLLDFNNQDRKMIFIPVLEAKKAFNKRQALVTVDSMDKDNLILIVSKGAYEVKFPQNQNIAIVNGMRFILPEKNLYIGDDIKIDVDKWYLSPEAIDLIN